MSSNTPDAPVVAAVAKTAKTAKKPAVKKPLAKAVPVAPWPPAAVTGKPVAAPAGRKPGAPVAARKAVAKPTDKAVKAVKAGAKQAKPATSAGDDKPAKIRVKLVRDSFTMPQVDFDLIDTLKKRALGFQHPVKKSELLRAGLQALAALDDAQLTSLLKGLPLLKPGRPKKAG